MGTNYTVDPVSGNTPAIDINDNFNNIQTALERSLSRYGNSPNTMQAILDMNNNEIHNLPKPDGPGQAARYDEVAPLIAAFTGGASALVFAGTWDASSGAFPSGASNGYVYIVDTAGTVDSVSFSIGDKLVALTDSPSTTTFLGDWEIIVSVVSSGINFVGTWDASNSTFPTGAGSGDLYVVNTAGTVDSVSFSVNDRLLALVDSPSTTTYASNWLKMLYASGVTSVFGRTGTITSNTGDYTADEISETATNKILTAAERIKLAGVATGAEVNVQSDWAQADNTKDDYIKNQPAIPTNTSDLVNDSGFVVTELDPTVPSQVKSITNLQITGWNSASAKAANISVTQSVDLDSMEQGLTNVTSAAASNTAARHTHPNKVILDSTTQAFTIAQGNKLSAIADNAEVNVQSDWDAVSGDALILNKPEVNKTFVAAVAPTTTDDSAAGYSVGSVGVNTAVPDVYICTDNTATAAVWTKIN